MLSESPLRVAILVRSPLLAEALRCHLARDGIEASVAGHNSEAGIRYAALRPNDLILAGSQLADGPVWAFVRKLRRHRIGTTLAFVGERFTEPFVQQALTCHVGGLILDSEPPDTFTRMVRDVAEGQFVCSESVRRLIKTDRNGRMLVTRDAAIDELTATQLEILIRIAEGDAVKEIGAAMGVSVKSIDSHKYRMMRRLGIHDRVQLARFAIREGLVDP